MLSFRNLMIALGIILVGSTVLHNLKNLIAEPVPIPESEPVVLQPGNNTTLIGNAALQGFVNHVGGNIEYLSLRNYTEDGQEVTLLKSKPAGHALGQPHEVAIYGWNSDSVATPTKNTLWTKVSSGNLSNSNDLVLEYQNPQGITFQRRMSLDDKYLFTVTQTAQNHTGESILLAPYASLQKDIHSVPPKPYLSHTGVIGVLEGSKIEHSYADLRADPALWTRDTRSQAYIGYTDAYWLKALFPVQQDRMHSIQRGPRQHLIENSAQPYDVRIQSHAIEIPAAGVATFQTRLYTGVKELGVLNEYNQISGIDNLTDSIDWGMFWFVTKPVTYVIEFFYDQTGNIALALFLVGVTWGIFTGVVNFKAYIHLCRTHKIDHLIQETRARHGGNHKEYKAAIKDLKEEYHINGRLSTLPIVMSAVWVYIILKTLANAAILHSAAGLPWVANLNMTDPTSIMNLYGLMPWAVPSSLGFGIIATLIIINVLIRTSLMPVPPERTSLRIKQVLILVYCGLITLLPVGALLTLLGAGLCEGILIQSIRKFMKIKNEFWKNIMVTLQIQKIPE